MNKITLADIKNWVYQCNSIHSLQSLRAKINKRIKLNKKFRNIIKKTSTDYALNKEVRKDLIKEIEKKQFLKENTYYHILEPSFLISFLDLQKLKEGK